jgi:Rrf2 family nitric oxide-sensitive transcriptional repressor
MRLTLRTDYALRVLIQLALAPERLGSIRAIAAAYGISENHLMKVVHNLVQKGYVESSRGRGGGIRLAREASAIVVGDVVRNMEDDLALVECFDVASNACAITRACRLKGILFEALGAFLAVLDRYTIADLLGPAAELRAILGIGELAKAEGVA